MNMKKNNDLFYHKSMREIVCDQLDNCSVVLLEYLNDPIDALVSNYEDAQVIRYDILG